VTSDQFLDEAILEMAKGGPRETWKLGVVDGPAWREDRDTWAARVVDDALALATRRERKLAEIAAVEAAVDAVVGLTKRDIVMPGPAPDPVREHLSRQIVQSTDDRMMASTPGAALDAEADALRVACGGIFSWDDIGKGAQNDWRAVAQKAREMHRKTASLSECADVFYGEGLRAVLQHLGVEVTPW